MYTFKEILRGDFFCRCSRERRVDGLNEYTANSLLDF